MRSGLKPGDYKLKGTLGFQECSDQICKIPRSVTFEIPFKIDPMTPAVSKDRLNTRQVPIAKVKRTLQSRRAFDFYLCASPDPGYLRGPELRVVVSKKLSAK